MPDRMAPQTLPGWTEVRRLRSPGEKQTPPHHLAGSDTHSGLLQAFFSVFGASATCWHPGLRALGSFCALQRQAPPS